MFNFVVAAATARGTKVGLPSLTVGYQPDPEEGKPTGFIHGNK